MIFLTLKSLIIAAAETTTGKPQKTATLSSTGRRMNVFVTVGALESTEINGATGPTINILLATIVTLTTLLMIIF